MAFMGEGRNSGRTVEILEAYPAVLGTYLIWPFRYASGDSHCLLPGD